MKFIAIGELMLRLSPPNYEKLVTTHDSELITAEQRRM